MRSGMLAAALCVSCVGLVSADEATSGRLSARDFPKAYPGAKVFATGATASSSYGRSYGPEEAIGEPKVFPRLGCSHREEECCCLLA